MKPVDMNIMVCHAIPNIKDMQPNVLYVSHKNNLTFHLCPCGCGELVSGTRNNLVVGTSFFIRSVRDIDNKDKKCKTKYRITRNIITFI